MIGLGLFPKFISTYQSDVITSLLKILQHKKRPNLISGGPFQIQYYWTL
jgi:hypothetical protein